MPKKLIWRVACFYKTSKGNKVEYKYLAAKNASEAVREIKNKYGKKFFSYKAYKEY